MEIGHKAGIPMATYSFFKNEDKEASPYSLDYGQAESEDLDLLEQDE